MTYKFLHLKSCFLMMLLLVGVGNSAWAERTYKLTKVTKVENGGLYVFEQGGYVMNNTCASSALQTTNRYSVSGLTGTETYIWKLTSSSKGFKMMNVSLDENNKSAYLANTSSTTVSFNTGGAVWAFNFQNDGTVLIQNTNNKNRFLGYSSSSSHAYRAYATGNLDSYPHAIVVYKLEEESSDGIATPTFSVQPGTYEEPQNVEITCETEGTTIYYTLDGTEPTKESTKYNGAITVSETTTIKAIAYNAAGETSKVATATYTFPVVYATIADFKAANTTTGYLNLTGAQVVFIDNGKNNIYVRDATGATSLYSYPDGFDVNFKTGDILKGTVKATNGDFNGQPQLNDVDLTSLTVSGNEVVVAKVIEGTPEAIADNLCDLVKIENTTITKSGNKYYVGTESDIQLWDQFKAGLTFTAGKTADVQGIAAVYKGTNEIFPRFESDIVYLDNSVPVAIGAAGMATFSCDEALDFTGTDAIYAYTATLDGKTINFTRVRKVPARTGILLRNPLGESAVEAVNVPVIADDATDDVSNNIFVAALEEISSLPTEQDGNTNYILNKVGGKLGFYKAAGQKVGAGKAYLKVPAGETPASMIAISFEGDVTTGVKTFSSDERAADSVAYDLQGRRVARPTKGLYIVNGKKIVK